MTIPLLVIQVITFIFLIVVLKALFNKHLNTALTRLKGLHQENLARETELNQKIKQAQEQKRAQIEEGKKEAKQIIEVAKNEAAGLRSNTETDAQHKADRILQKGREEIEKIKKNLATDTESSALNLSVQMIQHTFSSQGKEALHRQFIEEIISEIEELDKSKFTVKAKDVVVKTSYPLNDKEREEIKKVLSKKLGIIVEVEESVDEELIVGLLIQIESLIIDGSLKNRLKRIIPHIKRI